MSYVLKILVSADDIDERLTTINDYFTFSLYSNVCRSLFERNKIHFAFLLCARIMMDQKRIDPAEWKFLLAGGDILKVNRKYTSDFSIFV